MPYLDVAVVQAGVDLVRVRVRVRNRVRVRVSCRCAGRSRP